MITDKEVCDKARSGDLVGWSFGFQDRDVEQGVEQGLPIRLVKDLDLFEVSILDRTKSPAYDGTLLMARSDDEVTYHGEALIDDVDVEEIEITADEIRSDECVPEQEEHPEADKSIDYSEYESIISEMKGAYRDERTCREEE